MNLHHAAEYMDLELAQRLLAGQVDVNKPDEFGQTALHIAIDAAVEEAIFIYDTEQRAVAPRVELIEVLLAHGANPNLPDSNGRTPRDWALERKNAAFIAAIDQLIAKYLPGNIG